jgi:hypothetical protein
LSLGKAGQPAIVDPGPIVLGRGGGGGGGGGTTGGTVVGAAVGSGAEVVVVAASVVDVEVLVVVVDVATVVVVGSLRPASTNEVGEAVPSPESHAAPINSIVSANAQIRLRM